MSMTADAPPSAEIATENLGVRFYRRDPSRVVVAFASAGARKTDGFAEEFRSSFWPTGVSLIFVTDRRTKWFNFADTENVFRSIASWTSEFAHVGAYGESMGGSAAILFSDHARVDRVAALAPQYSILPPFVNFDFRYAHVHRMLDHISAEDFSVSPVKDRSIVVYGNTSWEDHLHASMFRVAGFPVLNLDGAGHEIGEYLKTAFDSNMLRPFVDLFCDFSRPWTPKTLRDAAAVGWTEEALKPSCRFAQTMRDTADLRRGLESPVEVQASRWPLVSENKTADQSSICEWSIGVTTQDDARRALNGVISAQGSFHTGHDPRAWWSVDLGEDHDICEVRLFNRLEHVDIARRNANFRLDSSRDGTTWEPMLVKRDFTSFGGADGRPFVHLPDPPRRLRHLRVQRLLPGVLHLNQVQLFGTRSGLPGQTADAPV